MKFYMVGGAVRDLMLGVKQKDYDFVVVGATPDDFSEWKQVGKDFPVFLHPVTGWEVALARTELKTGRGHTDFSVETSGVTLEEDLSRRDLTINSVAIEVDFDTSVLLGEPVLLGGFIDPFNGVSDAKAKVLRHTSSAFSEDPLRVLRVARFLSRLPEWTVAEETADTMRGMDLSHLTPERVWLETLKAMGENKPSLYFEKLSEWCDVFPIWNCMQDTPQRLDHHPEGDVATHVGMVMDYAAETYKDTEITFAALCHDFGKPVCWELYENAHGHEDAGLPLIEDFCNKWKVPNSYKKLALMTCKYHTKIHGCLGRSSNSGMRPKSIMKLFEDTGALRNPEMFLKMLKVCEADSRGRGKGTEQINEFRARPYPQREFMEQCLNAVLRFNTKPLSEDLLAKGKSGVIIGETIRQERIKLIRGIVNNWR